MSLNVGDRKPCPYGTRTVPVCGIDTELRQGPNPALPPGRYEVASGAPHTCRTWCFSCQRKVGGPDLHGLGCEAYARLAAASAALRGGGW